MTDPMYAVFIHLRAGHPIQVNMERRYAAELLRKWKDGAFAPGEVVGDLQAEAPWGVRAEAIECLQVVSHEMLKAQMEAHVQAGTRPQQPMLGLGKWGTSGRN